MTVEKSDRWFLLGLLWIEITRYAEDIVDADWSRACKSQTILHT